MCSLISASRICCTTLSTISRKKERSSSKTSCAIGASTLRWSLVIVAPFRSVDIRHQPSWRTMTLLSSGPSNYRSLRTQPLLVAFGVVGIAIAAVPMDTTTALRTSSTLRNAVRVDAIMEHERVFQKIANSNDHTRVSGTPGYDASAEYVAGKLRAAGYAVTLQTFTFPFFQEVGQSTFERVSPDPRAYVRGNEGDDVMDYSGPGDVTAKVVPTQDVQIPPSLTPSSTSGCEATDFAGFPAGSVALIQRGTCTFGQKVQNAEAAGAIGAIIFNEGQPGRTEMVDGRLGAPANIPA